jgi:RNA polymerase sigma-70 factor, ECF subfamily
MTYDEIYKTYSDCILKYLSRTVGYEDAQDLTQEVFVNVYKSYNNFENKSSIYTWIYKIATNLIIDHKRKKSLHVDRCNLNDKSLFCKANSEYLTEEFKIVETEMHECICSYIKMLPPKDHTIIVLREYESMSIQDISTIMNINIETARKQLYRAKKKLRKILIERCNFYYNENNLFSCEKI